MNKIEKSVAGTLVAGLLIIAPIYLAALLLLKVMDSLARIVRPVANLLPRWLPAAHLLSLLLALIVVYFVGLSIRTRIGRRTWEWVDQSLLHRVPGYVIFQGLTKQLAGESRDQAWKPALAEIEDALVPAFIVEELDDGCFTVFIPSVPTPLAGTVYILTPDRVHPLRIPLAKAIQAVSQWGSGSKELVAAMEQKKQADFRIAK